jgi:hypothetical protein
MRFTFSIVYEDNLHHNISADNCKEIVVQECAKTISAEAETLEYAVLDIQSDLVADSKTLKSLVLQRIEV